MSNQSIPSYNIADWYFNVGASITQVWATGRAEFVALSDSAYQTWVALGNTATPVATPAALFAILKSQWLPALLSNGVATTASAGQPFSAATFAMDTGSQLQMSAVVAGFANAVVSNPSASPIAKVQFPDISGNVYSFNQAQFTATWAALQNYVAGVIGALNTAVNGTPASLPTTPVAVAALPTAVHVNLTANATLDNSAMVWPFDATSGDLVATVPLGSSLPNQGFTVKKVDSGGNTVTVTMTSSDKIDGASTYVLSAQWDSVTFQNQRGTATWLITATV